MSYAIASAARAKSPEAFRTISEVADELQVPQHVLRFWESRFTQVKPVKRAGGRRYYRPDDVDLLRGIRALLYGDGFTVKGVQKILRDRGARYVIEIGRSAVPTVMFVPESALNADDFIDDEEDLPHTNVVPLSARSQAVIPEPVRTEPVAEYSDVQGTPTLAEDKRERLEILLAELVQMKMRLRTARAVS